MTATWQPVANEGDGSYGQTYQVERLVTGDGKVIAMLEDFGYAAYPTALNAETGNLERGGPHSDRVAAILWAERVAGLHPTKPGDERPAFYYDPAASA